MRMSEPIYFQGSLKKRNYFEGWYYKMVSKDTHTTVALIPGVSLNPVDTHAFIQVFITKRDDHHESLLKDYLRYDLSDFHVNKKEKRYSIASQHFSDEGIDVDFKTEGIELKGNLRFSSLTPIKINMFSPSIMGPFSYLPLMECYHGIISMNHSLSGTLNINGKDVVFDGGKGYIEKDYGRSFPSEYIWMQTNHFETESTSLMLSYAKIPFLGMTFNGLIANLVIGGEEYRFATYNGARVKEMHINSQSVKISIKKRSYRLIVEASSEKTVHLPSPKNGVMNQSIKEGLSGTVNIELYRAEALIYRDQGHFAGLEIMMDPKDKQ